LKCKNNNLIFKRRLKNEVKETKIIIFEEINLKDGSLIRLESNKSDAFVKISGRIKKKAFNI
jgi:hypothetical protein